MNVWADSILFRTTLLSLIGLVWKTQKCLMPCRSIWNVSTLFQTQTLFVMLTVFFQGEWLIHLLTRPVKTRSGFHLRKLKQIINLVFSRFLSNYQTKFGFIPLQKWRSLMFLIFHWFRKGFRVFQNRKNILLTKWERQDTSLDLTFASQIFCSKSCYNLARKFLPKKLWKKKFVFNFSDVKLKELFHELLPFRIYRYSGCSPAPKWI